MKLFNKILLIALLTIFCQSLFAQQQTPQPPVDFKVSIEEVNSGIVLKLTWMTNPEGIVPQFYNIYYTANNQDKLILHGQVKHIENQNEYKYYIHQLNPGIYSFHVTALVKMNGAVIESSPSELRSITFGETKKLSFASNPLTQIKVGENYIYEMKAHSQLKCEYSFELLSGPEGMTIQHNTINWLPEKVGEYKVAVRVFYPECDEKAEDVQSFVIRVIDGQNSDLFVKIEMEEVINMKLGETITRQLRAESNANCPVIFEFQNEKYDGFKFDGQGMFVFAPQKEGQYVFVLKAYLSCDKNIHDLRKFIIIVGEGHQEPKHCALIKGTVVTEDNLPVAQGIVNALKLDRADKNEQPYFKGKISEGNFEITVPEGNYALDISGEGIYAEWYQDAEFVTEATRITIACEATIEVSAIVKSLPVPKHFTVSGRVFDKDSNEPVYAQIQFIPAESIFNNTKPNDKARFAVNTDAHGNYTITLPDNFTYVAQAVSAMNSVRYNVQYYKEVVNPMDAELIQLTENLENVDFALTQYQEIKTGFSGIVYDNQGQTLKSKVIAYCIKSANEYFKEVNMTFAVETDENGIYRFDNLIPGDYVVLSIPENKEFVPGYYNKNDFVVLKWKESSVISVGETMIEMMFDFKHNLRGDLGLVKIGGKIINKGGVMGAKSDKSHAGSPVAGAYVFVVDENGTVSDYGFSNSEGSFDMNEVAEGILRIFADKVGMETYEGVIETNYNEKSNVQLEFGMEEATVGVDDFSNQSNSLIAYPMPVQTNLNVEFFSDAVYQSEFKVYNTLGNNMLSSDITIEKGKNTISIDLSTIPTGSYIVSIYMGTRKVNEFIQVIR